MLATRVKRSHKHRGQRLIVIDIRKHEMAERADMFIQPKPSTDEALLMGVSKYILDHNLAKMDFVHQWVNHFDEFAKSLEPYTLGHTAEITGLPETSISTLANEIAAAESVCALWAMGVTQHCGGSDTSTSISNLLLLTGNYKRPGTGAYPLRGHNNVQGASDFGSMPNIFSGYQKVDDESVRAKFEADWGCTLPTTKGLDNREMIDAVHKGKLKAMYIKGEDTITSDSNANDVGDALRKLDFLIVQDINFSETCKYADLVLPASPSLEKEGTFVNTERRIQRLYKALEPLGDSKPDWEILQLIANRMGGKWSYKHPADVMVEVARLTPTLAGVTYERLEGYQSLQWPVAKDGTDTPLCYVDKFPFPDGKAKFHPLEYKGPSEEVSERYDLHLNNGRLLEHFEQGSMTYRSPGIKRMTPETFLEVSPELAAERGLSDGRYVQLQNAYGRVKVQVLVTDRVKGRQLFMPLNSVEEPVNLLTSSHVDRATHTPAFKETAVEMTLLPERGKSPLPRVNFRNGTRHPQAGVEIERKWAQPGYHLPGNAEER